MSVAALALFLAAGLRVDRWRMDRAIVKLVRPPRDPETGFVAFDHAVSRLELERRAAVRASHPVQIARLTATGSASEVARRLRLVAPETAVLLREQDDVYVVVTAEEFDTDANGLATLGSWVIEST